MAAAGDAAAGGGISGRVTGPDGQPLAGVEVHAHVTHFFPQPRDMFATFPPNSGGLAAWTVTAADGTYEFVDLATTPVWQPLCDGNSPSNFGHYILLFSPPRETGFLPKVFRERGGPHSPLWTQLTVEEGKTITGVDVQLGPPASIAGTVTRSDGTPVAGAIVAVEVEPVFYGDSWPQWLFVTRTTTDGRGRYVLTGVEFDDYWLRVTVPGATQPYVLYPGTADPVRVRPLHGGRNDGFDVTVQTPGSILVTDPPGHGGWAEGFASPRGPNFIFPDPYPAPHLVEALPPGTYRVAISSPPPWSVTWYPGTFQWEDAAPVVVRSGETTAISFSPAPLGTATGRVVDGTGTPVADVEVGVSDLSPCYPPQVFSTDAEGNFTLFSGGDRKLSFGKEGYFPVWYNGQPDQDAADFVRFRSGESTALGDVVLESRGAPGGIAGVVTAAGAPLAGARVEIWSSPAGSAALATVTPAADGSFEAPGLLPDPYLLRFFDSTPGSVFGEKWYPDAVSPATATPVTVQPGLLTGGIDADLGAVGNISGIMTVDGQPPDNDWYSQDDLCLADVLGRKLLCVKPSFLDGTYRFDGVVPGTYLLAVDVTMHHSFGRWYPDEPSAATAQPITVSPGASLSGIDANLQPWGFIQVPLSVTSGDKGGWYHLVDADTDKVWESGYFSPGLHQIWAYPGRYRLVYSFWYWQMKHYPQWYPGKHLASDAEIIEVLPGQTVTLSDTVLEYWGYNRAPALAAPGSLSASEGLPSSFTLDASDPDGDLLTFSATNLPQGATLDPYTGAFSWTPTCTQAGAYPDVTFTVTDHGNPPLSASATMAVNVAGRDCAPVLDPIGARSVIAGEPLTFPITASDPEGDPIVLEASGLPPGASFNAADGTFAWTPDGTQGGVHSVTFAAAYAGDTSLRDEEVVTITVLGPLLFRDDFAHGDLPADPDWVTVAGAWAVREGAFRSKLEGDAIALTGPGNLAGTGFAAGQIRSRVKLGPRALRTPDLAFVFGYRDRQHYRYVRFLPGATEIGQVGEIDGQPALRLRKARGAVAGRWWRARVDIHPGGLVRAFLGELPLAALKFPTAVPGGAGVMTRNSRSFVDDFTLWARTVLN